jgi:hypothetical protein
MKTHRTRGQTLAEFALVLPVLLLIAIGLLDVGRIVFSYTAMTNAAREGARLASVNQTPADIELRVRNQTPIVNPTTTVEFHRTEPNPDALDNADCSPLNAGCIAVVIVEADIDVITPLIGNLVGPFNLTAEAQMPIDFVCPSSIAGFTCREP